MRGRANPIIWDEQKEATDELLNKKRQEEGEGVIFSIISQKKTAAAAKQKAYIDPTQAIFKWHYGQGDAQSSATSATTQQFKHELQRTSLCIYTTL